MKKYIPLEPKGILGQLHDKIPLMWTRLDGTPVFGYRYIDYPYRKKGVEPF